MNVEEARKVAVPASIRPLLRWNIFLLTQVQKALEDRKFGLGRHRILAKYLVLALI
jgi:hypothetical protein